MATRQSRAAPAGTGSLTPDRLARDLAAAWEQVAASCVAWYESWLEIVTLPFAAALRGERSFPRPAAPEHERRAGALPWVPQFDAQVIPLRRASDPPGREASRLTMSVAMPAVPGAAGCAGLLRVDTVLPLVSPAALEAFGEQAYGGLDPSAPADSAGGAEGPRGAGDAPPPRPATH